jgi:uncharacterized protein (TIGR02996 family)
MDNGPQLGKLIEGGDDRRDAIHIAVAPGTAAARLAPGQHVGFARDGDTETFGPSPTPIGIVDPFLSRLVDPGERFWVFLYPGTITGLRHVWTHPAFEAAPAVAMDTATSERDRFLRALEVDEDDATTRRAYADWLDRHGEHGEAERQRRWPGAKAWLVGLALEHNLYAEEARVIGYEQLLDIGREAASSARDDTEAPFYSASCGNNESMCGALRANREVFWETWSIVTGTPIPPDVARRSSFHCAC